MKIHTKYHGEREIDHKTIWQFENGVPGFQDEKEFIILPLQDIEEFSVLQCIKSPEIAFIIANPFAFFKEYEFRLDDLTIEQLALQKEENVQVMVILNVKDPFDQTTANLQAPVIFNMANRNAKQVILNDTNYKTKHPLFDQNAAKEEG